MFTALFWVFADYIGNTPARIIVKIIILGVFIMIELCVWINATLPWLESKEANKPRIRVEKQSIKAFKGDLLVWIKGQFIW